MSFRAAFVVPILLLASFAVAFIEKKPPGKAWIPEETDASIEKQLVHNGEQPVVGVVPADTTPDRTGSPPVDPGARDALALGSAAIDSDQVLAEGGKREGREEPKSRSWIWAIVFGGLGLGTVLAVRQWANKAIPEPRQRSW